MTAKERLEMSSRTGIPFMSLYSIEIQTKQLGRNGLSKKQIRSAIANMHPMLFENLKLNNDGTVKVIDERLEWRRRNGWFRR
jgi:hypothetical protein